MAFSSQTRQNSELSHLTESPVFSNEAITQKGCLNCGKPDHYVRDCDQPLQLHCYNCHKKGYTVRTCPDCNQQNFQMSELAEEPPPQPG